MSNLSVPINDNKILLNTKSIIYIIGTINLI